MLFDKLLAPCAKCFSYTYVIMPNLNYLSHHQFFVEGWLIYASEIIHLTILTMLCCGFVGSHQGSKVLYSGDATESGFHSLL